MPNRSVMAKAERISPFSSGVSHSFCCSGDPYRARTSDELQQALSEENRAVYTHVTGIRSRTVDCFRSHMSPTSDYLGHDSVLSSSSIVVRE